MNRLFSLKKEKKKPQKNVILVKLKNTMNYFKRGKPKKAPKHRKKRKQQ